MVFHGNATGSLAQEDFLSLSLDIKVEHFGSQLLNPIGDIYTPESFASFHVVCMGPGFLSSPPLQTLMNPRYAWICCLESYSLL